MVIIHNHPILRNRRSELRIHQTPQEILVWARLRRNQLGYKFKRQHSIGPYILDFYCPNKKLAIELDGSQHIENKEYDNERSKYLEELNIKVLRFTNAKINTNITEVIENIIDNLKNQ